MSAADRASPYRYVRTIASGGMGSVDLVMRREGAFARAYAMKRLLPHLAESGELRAMFLEEARIAGLIRHANVASVLDVGEDDDGPYLVMDLVEGIPVASLVACAVDRSELLPVQICVDIARQVADGLAAAHELVGPGGHPTGVVHRDVSPSNVLVGFDGVIRVTDFGIARALDRGGHTRVGVVKGKPGYVTPEQVRAEPVDARTDLFALGVVLYEMLAGEKLYAGEPRDVFRSIVEEAPPDIGERRRDVPASLSGLLFELMAKGRSERPESARDVSRRLGSIYAEMLSTEEPIELSEYLLDHHSHERDSQRELVHAALEDRDETEAVEMPPHAVHDAVTAELRLDTRTPRVDVPEPAPARGRSASAALAIGAIALLALGAGALWASVDGPGAPTTDAQLPSPPATTPTPPSERIVVEPAAPRVESPPQPASEPAESAVMERASDVRPSGMLRMNRPMQTMQMQIMGGANADPEPEPAGSEPDPDRPPSWDWE